MKAAFLNRLMVNLAAVGFLTIAPAAFGQTVEPEKQTGTPASELAMPIAAVHSLSSSVELELFSNVLLAVLYFALPAGLGLALFLHDKQDAERSKRLNAQIELLERLWNQHPQH